MILADAAADPNVLNHKGPTAVAVCRIALFL